MSTGTITITAGRDRDPDANEFAGDDGTYPVILVDVTEPVTEPSQLDDSGSWTYRRWTFAIDGGDHDGQTIDCRASTKSGPRSKQVKIIAALFGRTPPAGTQIDIKKHLVGRSALVSIATNDNGYPYISGFMAAPTAPKPKAEQAKAEDFGDLPF